ncbi:MAG: TetR/AcrR family transcriptional regulator [Coriobacteriales bacterium]|jgi:AcrR family transcriptional regulator
MERYPQDGRPKDLRVEKTIDAIHAAFKEMLSEMDFGSITVKELCARARVNKKTFYRYYPAIEYLLQEIQEEYVQGYLPRVRGLRFPEDAAACAREFILYSAAQDELYEKITCTGPHDSIRESMIERVEGETILQADEVPAGWEVGDWKLYLELATTIPLAMYRTWVAGGKKLSPETLAQRSASVVAGLLRSFGH